MLFLPREEGQGLVEYALILVLVTTLPVQAAVRAELDRPRITEGETVTLTFLTDDAKKNLDTDFTPLEADFEILDRRTETQLSIVNGRQTALVRLLLTVEPTSTAPAASCIRC